MDLWLICLVVVVVISASLGLFEVWGITHYKVGWGEVLPQDKIWGKPVLQKAPFNLVGLQLLSRYHFVMYFFVVPIVVALGFALAGHSSLNWFGWLANVIGGTMGVMAGEDFLFFVFSASFGKPYPHALARLFRGEATWHTQQINFQYFTLPAIYFWMPPVAAFLFWVGSQYGSN